MIIYPNVWIKSMILDGKHAITVKHYGRVCNVFEKYKNDRYFDSMIAKFGSIEELTINEENMKGKLDSIDISY